jgi:hypothetical protein
MTVGVSLLFKINSSYLEILFEEELSIDEYLFTENVYDKTIALTAYVKTGC